jgi:lambda family phage portal protein
VKAVQKLLARFGYVPKTSGQRSVFAGAQQNRLTNDWFAQWMSGRQELRYELRLLRMRSRELCRNNPYAKRLLNLIAQNVVGPDGIDCEPDNETAGGKPYDALNESIETAWDLWSRPEYCTVDGLYSWRELLALIVQTEYRDGEVFLRKVKYADNPFGFSLQLLDADQFDESYERAPSANQNGINMGVEFDRYGRPVAYWMWSTHPSDTLEAGTRQRLRIPADEIIHYFEPQRPGQLRGVPKLAPSMFSLKLLEGYFDAEITAARTAAAKMGWIQPSMDAPGPDPDDAGQQNQPLDAAAGVIERLGAGETFQGWDPTHPSGNFSPFVSTVLHQIASGFNVSHAALTTDLNGVSFSSIRTGTLDEHDGYRMQQQRVIGGICDPVYATWLPMAQLAGAVRLPSEDVAKWSPVCWEPRGWEWVDPLSDNRADIMAIAAGLETRTAVVAKRGLNWVEDVANVLKQEMEVAKELGLTFVADVPGSQPAPNDAGAADPAAPAPAAAAAPRNHRLGIA